jgi:hypothetical protein
MQCRVHECRASPPNSAGRQLGCSNVSPAHNENVGFYGTFSFEVEHTRELAQLVADYRPLRLVK